MTTSDLRKLIETERNVEFWGQSYKCTPCFVEAKLGNGKQLLAVQPLDTRPDYYVIRIDSSWNSEKGDIHDHLDDIVDAIIDEYSEREREREYLIEDGCPPAEADLNGHEKELGWPVFSDSCGIAWWEIDWPKPPRKRPSRATA